MQRPLFIRLLTILTVIIVLSICLSLVGGLIDERQERDTQVRMEIASSTAHAQNISAPMIIVAYRKREVRWVTETESAANTQPRRKKLETRRSGELVFLPEVLNIEGRLGTQRRSRGIFEALLYQGAFEFDATFEMPANFGITEDLADYQFDQPKLVLGLSDVRGIQGALEIIANGSPLAPESGTASNMVATGVHAPLQAIDTGALQNLNVKIRLNLLGTDALQIVPLGNQTDVSLTADWPHPSFTGRFLPVDREVRADGFNARWSTNALATGIMDRQNVCSTDKCGPAAFTNATFGVRFLDPVDHYRKSERAVKYGLLFIALTFAGVFLHEVLRRKPVHPVQYGLVGLALVTFYVLLLALSEHIGFAIAYLVSTAASVGLIGVYLWSVLASRTATAAFVAQLAGVYGALYLILDSEDFALLLGGLLTFAALATLMIATRNINWFSLDLRVAASDAQDAER